jgi:4-hydroxybenzoate polyprenyltransferase
MNPAAVSPPIPRWRVYLRLGRVSNLPTVWTNVLAGAALAGVAPSAASAVLLGAAVSLFYIGGMFLNDAFDHAVDARERPERPIPSGLVSAREVFAAGFGMLAAGAVATLAHVAMLGGSTAAVWAGVALAATIMLYNVWHKGNPLGPVLMGVCRALVYILAALAVAGRLPTAVLAGALALLCYLVGLTYTAKQETLGRVRNLWPLALLAAPLVYAAPAVLRSPAAALLAVALLGWIGFALRLLLRPVPDVPRAVVSLIAGIALVDALLIARAGFAALAAVAALGLPVTLLLQRYVRGT